MFIINLLFSSARSLRSLGQVAAVRSLLEAAVLRREEAIGGPEDLYAAVLWHELALVAHALGDTPAALVCQISLRSSLHVLFVCQ